MYAHFGTYLLGFSCKTCASQWINQDMACQQMTKQVGQVRALKLVQG
jgi:hypothetical protein